MWGYIYNFLSSWTNSPSMESGIDNINNNLDTNPEIIKENVLKIENCYYTYHQRNQIKKWKEKAKKELIQEIEKIKNH
jgi:hypothetical protein